MERKIVGEELPFTHYGQNKKKMVVREVLSIYSVGTKWKENDGQRVTKKGQKKNGNLEVTILTFICRVTK